MTIEQVALLVKDTSARILCICTTHNLGRRVHNNTRLNTQDLIKLSKVLPPALSDKLVDRLYKLTIIEKGTK